MPADQQIQEADRRAVLEFLRTEYGIDTDRDPDPLINLGQIAGLAGVTYGTVTVWIQRSRPDWTRPGKLTGDRAFPAPDNPDRYDSDRPKRRAVSTVLPWLIRTRKWPRGTAGREHLRKQAA